MSGEIPRGRSSTDNSESSSARSQDGGNSSVGSWDWRGIEELSISDGGSSMPMEEEGDMDNQSVYSDSTVVQDDQSVYSNSTLVDSARREDGVWRRAVSVDDSGNGWRLRLDGNWEIVQQQARHSSNSSWERSELQPDGVWRMVEVINNEGDRLVPRSERDGYQRAGMRHDSNISWRQGVDGTYVPVGRDNSMGRNPRHW